LSYITENASQHENQDECLLNPYVARRHEGWS
jgi:hypothetical protein